MSLDTAMYVWRSNLLANYAPGYIIVVAQDLASARRFAELEVKEHVCSLKDYLFIDDEDYEQALAKGLKDLEAEPEVRMSILIKGSE